MRLLYPAGPSVATEQTTKQPPDYSASPDFFVGPIGLFEIWRSAIIPSKWVYMGKTKKTLRGRPPVKLEKLGKKYGLCKNHVWYVFLLIKLYCFYMRVETLYAELFRCSILSVGGGRVKRVRAKCCPRWQVLPLSFSFCLCDLCPMRTMWRRACKDQPQEEKEPGERQELGHGLLLSHLFWCHSGRWRWPVLLKMAHCGLLGDLRDYRTLHIDWSAAIRISVWWPNHGQIQYIARKYTSDKWRIYIYFFFTKYLYYIIYKYSYGN